MNDPDREIMSAVARGDHQAMSELVRRWQRPVVGYVCRFLGCSSEEAMDVAQEAFVRVWTSAGRWRPSARFSTWMFTIVANLCRNELRGARRAPELVAIDGIGGDEGQRNLNCGPQHDPQAMVEAQQTAAALDRALAELPENQREALLLKQIEGLSYREIAAVLEISEKAVESLLVRARRTMTKKILG